MEWVNRVGMFLEFLSFWLAAPEVITEIRRDNGEWLTALQGQVEKGIRTLPIILAIMGSSSILWLMGVFFTDGSSVIQGLWFLLAANLALVFFYAGDELGRRKPDLFNTSFMIFLGLALATFLASEAWKVKSWEGVGLALLAVLAFVLEAVLVIKKTLKVLVWVVSGVVVTGLMVACWQTQITGWQTQIRGWGRTGIIAMLLMMTTPWIVVGNIAVAPLLRRLADHADIRRRWLAVGAVLFVVGLLLQFIGTF